MGLWPLRRLVQLIIDKSIDGANPGRFLQADRFIISLHRFKVPIVLRLQDLYRGIRNDLSIWTLFLGGLHVGSRLENDSARAIVDLFALLHSEGMLAIEDLSPYSELNEVVPPLPRRLDAHVVKLLNGVHLALLDREPHLPQLLLILVVLHARLGIDVACLHPTGMEGAGILHFQLALRPGFLGISSPRLGVACLQETCCVQ